MRKLFTLLAAVLLTATTWAQSPQRISYQAVVRSGATLVQNQAVGMQISILQTTSTGTAVYVETQTSTTDVNGLVTIEIGGGTPVTGTFAAINWSAGPYFIKTETDPAGGTNYSAIAGSSQLLSVPYALYAKTAESAVSGTGSLIHYIGELYGGGIVVSVWKIAGVEHGLIASLVDMSPAVVAWSDVTSTLIGLSAASQIEGQTNTTAIVAQSTATSAADLCDAYTNAETGTGVFSDWYLPAIWELNECYKAALITNNIVGGIDGFRFDFYWSSTEADATQAYYLGFHQNIYAANAAKSNLAGRVRAIRKF